MTLLTLNPVFMSNGAQQIAALNDSFRTTFEGGRVVSTQSVASLIDEKKFELLRLVQTFDDFTPDNDPYGEHDFGSVELDGEKYFWKIDYYNQDLTRGSEDASNNEITRRVMTIMLASEY